MTLSESGLQKFPKDPTFHRVAVWSAVDIEKFDVALQHAQVIMGTDSIKKTSRDYTYYGMALVGNKQYDEGIAQYEKALQLKADDPKPLQYISEAYKQRVMRTKRWNTASSIWTKTQMQLLQIS